MSVNYILEIDALDDWELTHPIPATAYKVMRKLQYLANKEQFPERISVPNTVLMSLTGCSEDSLIKARNLLTQVGLIEYDGKKKRTPVYSLRYFSLNPVYNSKLQSYQHGIKQGYKHGIEPGYEQGDEQGSYEEEREEENAVQYMQKCGVKLLTSQYEDIRDFYEQGITDDMLRYACDQAADHGTLSFAYIRKIVNSWICSGVRTLEAAKRRAEDFEAEKERSKPVSQQKTESSAAPKPKFFSERWSG